MQGLSPKTHIMYRCVVLCTVGFFLIQQGVLLGASYATGICNSTGDTHYNSAIINVKLTVTSSAQQGCDWNK